jgi:hypothetical protein
MPKQIQDLWRTRIQALAYGTPRLLSPIGACTSQRPTFAVGPAARLDDLTIRQLQEWEWRYGGNAS